MTGPRSTVLDCVQAAAYLGVSPQLIRAALFDSGLTPHERTGAHWYAADVHRLAEEPTDALLEAQRLSAAMSDEDADALAEATRKRRRRSSNVAPDPAAPELLSRVELVSALGLVGVTATAIDELLAEARIEETTEDGVRSWSADVVRDLAAHPTERLVGLRREAQPTDPVCSTFNAARLLGIRTRQVRPVMVDAGFEEAHPVGHWRRCDVEALSERPSDALLHVREGNELLPWTGRKLPPPARPADTDPLQRIVAHLGPTNSGKTYGALRTLVERARTPTSGVLVYAAPLRMMAQEAHAELSAELGSERVGLVTGEEQRNVDAPVLCTTTELAPSKGDVLCLDEVQWCADPQRGAAWTHRLLAAEYREMRLIGSPDALPVLRVIFGDRLEIERHDRLVPLHFVGAMGPDAVVRDSQRTIVIAFKRSAVLAVAGSLQRKAPDRPIAVLYGAMPLRVRRRQIERVRNGEVDLVVASDVLGHGVNLPCDRILFAETSKFDGLVRRDLRNFEIAQIAGRAGRYGLSEVGEVGVLEGIPYLRPDLHTIMFGLDAVEQVEGFDTYRRVETMVHGPQLVELDCDTAEELPAALRAWYARSSSRPRENVEVENPRPLLERLEFVAETLRARGSDLHALLLPDAWRLARSRLSPRLPPDRAALVETTIALDDDVPAETPQPDAYRDVGSLARLEQAAAYVDAMQWCAQAFPQLRLDRAALGQCERVIAEQFDDFLADFRSYETGRCKRCSRPCEPVHAYCPACQERFALRRRQAAA